MSRSAGTQPPSWSWVFLAYPSAWAETAMHDPCSGAWAFPNCSDHMRGCASHHGSALGEGVFPCALCELKCTWDSGDDGGAVCCDDFSMWFHRLCLDTSQSEYLRLGNSATSWHCIRCDIASVNSLAFHGWNIPIHNSFSVLQDMGEDSVFLPDRSAVLSPTSDFNPDASSSPRSTRFHNGW